MELPNKPGYLHVASSPETDMSPSKRFTSMFKRRKAEGFYVKVPEGLSGKNDKISIYQ